MQQPQNIIHTKDGVTYLLDFTLLVETMNHQIIEQTPDDTSRTTPGRSFFYDIKDLKLRKASLIGKGHIFTIDLVYGFAEVDGNKLYPPKAPPVGCDFRLLYYREVQQSVTLGLDGKVNHIPVVRYYIGWRTMVNNKNHQWELGVD